MAFDDADIAFMLGDAPLLCSIVPASVKMLPVEK
jgi:hypothetical protein